MAEGIAGATPNRMPYISTSWSSAHVCKPTSPDRTASDKRISAWISCLRDSHRRSVYALSSQSFAPSPGFQFPLRNKNGTLVVRVAKPYAHLGSRNSNRPDRSELRDLDARTAGIVVIDKKGTIVVPLEVLINGLARASPIAVIVNDQNAADRKTWV